jgi:glutamyl-tRNA synthetase
MTVRTRFAPSPTGYLHIGGVRTALFNWLFARKHSGQFILRIDDTDQQRNVAEALAPILHGFEWLGLNWDEGPEVGGPHGPYYQSQKLERYQAAVRELLDKGLAYWDYSTDAERAAEKAALPNDKQGEWVYSRRWLAETAADQKRFEAEGRTGVVRLKMWREGFCTFHDHVRGEKRFPWVSEADHVIQRADGTVLYNLANVVDDFDMKITHVIRAEEHSPNTPRQLFMIDGLGYPRPEYAHLPVVAEPGSKNKLSKRKIAQYLKNPDFKKVYEHGKAIAELLGLVTTPETFSPVLVEFYETVGYLPDAILNYLVLLGWSLDDKTEEFTRQQMIDLFSLERVNKGPASLDVKKLFAFQERYMQRLPVAEKVERVIPFLARVGLVSEPLTEAVRARVTAVVTEAGPRLIVAGDILNYTDFFVADDQLPYDDAAFDKNLRSGPGKDWLPNLRDLVANSQPFDATTLKQRVEGFSQAAGAKPKDVSQALRVAVTGKAVGFDAYGTLVILGRVSCLKRIERALKRLS